MSLRKNKKKWFKSRTIGAAILYSLIKVGKLIFPELKTGNAEDVLFPIIVGGLRLNTDTAIDSPLAPVEIKEAE